MKDDLKEILGALRLRLEALYGEKLVRLVLYGSRAREEDEPGSDIDVLVVLKGRANPGEEIARTGGIVAELSLRFGEVLSCVFVSEARFAYRNGPLLRNARREGIPL